MTTPGRLPTAPAAAVCLMIVALPAAFSQGPAPSPVAGGPDAVWPGPPPAAAEPMLRLADASSLPPTDPLGFESQQAARPQGPPGMPPGTRPGVFQKLGLEAGYLPRFEDDSLGIRSLGANVVLGFPFPSRRSPLLVTPRYRALFLDGPDFVDVPPRLHEASVGLSHFRKLGDRWLFNGAIDLGVFADDDRFGDDDSFFVTGRALGIKELTSTWKGVVGAVYVNRAGLSVFPALGLLYDDGRMQVDLVFPRPRVAWLLPGSTPEPGDQRWLLLLGEFGGGRYAVQRDGGGDDTLSYGDARVALGYERKVIGGVSSRWDLGYVFARELEFDSDGNDLSLDDTLMLRRTMTY